MRKVFRKLFRLLFRLSLFALFIIGGIVAIRTIAFSSRQIPVEPVEKTAVSDEVVGRLSQALTFPTISGEGFVDTAAFLEFNAFLSESFPLADSLLDTLTINRFSRIYRWPGRNPKLPPILLIAHLDVVPAEVASLGQWTFPPFSGHVADGYIWGRGALDDKGSVLAILETVEQLLKEDYLPERTLYLAFGHDEEVRGMKGAKEIAGYFKKEGIRFEYMLDEAQVVIENALPGLSRPLAMIGVAEKGYATLELTARLEEGGHSSMPPSETAIGLLSAALERLRKKPFPARIDGAVADMLDYAGPEMSLPLKAVFANRWLTERLLISQFNDSPGANAMIRTTAAPTMLSAGVKANVLPSEASAMVNFRILPGETPESVRRYVEDAIGDKRVEVVISAEDDLGLPSAASSANAFGFLVIKKTIQQIFPDAVVAPSLVVGATDSRHYSEVSDQIYRFLPVRLKQEDLSRFHGLNERIGVDAYKDMIRFYRQLILNSCM
jgi:carboxypeptidase PM20D1